MNDGDVGTRETNFSSRGKRSVKELHPYLYHVNIVHAASRQCATCHCCHQPCSSLYSNLIEYFSLRGSANFGAVSLITWL